MYTLILSSLQVTLLRLVKVDGICKQKIKCCTNHGNCFRNCRKVTGKREFAGYQDFLLFPKHFQRCFLLYPHIQRWGHIVLPFSVSLSVHISVFLHKLNVKA